MNFCCYSSGIYSPEIFTDSEIAFIRIGKDPDPILYIYIYI